ncbi:MAG: [protein-PII] uridylyltransferase [Xanthomonadales bacterium]|nr:[protein-PII] uridylyltransferase [Xanthomonadales bacterium]
MDRGANPRPRAASRGCGRPGELSEGEWQELAAARATLTGLRFALHLLAGRAEERLLFDHQRELARRFGYRDEHAENLAVEQFMQTYYRAAHAVDRLGEILLERLAEQLEEPERQPALRLSLDFRLVGARIEAVDAGIFLSRPAAMVELFGAFAEHREATAIAAPTALALAAALPLVAARLPEDARALRAFLDILGRPGGVFRALSRMHRHGVLGALLPPFAAVTGRMQYDLFHAYTVDQHTLFVLRELDRLFDAGEADGEALPRAVAAQLRRPAPLYLAALFHDIAKGRGGDHSELGAAEARRFAARLGLGAGEAELIAWLVEAHLLMSRTAQREDIQDPAVVARFASAVGDRERLDLLYLLTVADIAATHPKLWNRWKAQLLAELYDAARLALRRGLASSPRRAERIAERRAATAALLAGAGLEGARLEAIWAEFPEDAFLRYEPDQLAWQTVLLAERGGDAAPLVAVRSPAARAATEVFVLCPDMDGLFAAIAATLDRLELDVLAARIATTPRGLAFDTFLVHERDGGAVRDPARERAIAETLRRALAERPLRAEPVRRVLPRRQRHFARPPRIELTARGGLTELLLVCTDRPGLLATVARILRDEGLRVHEARIATLGERAEDIFLISDREGRPLAAEAEAGLAARLVGGSRRAVGGERGPRRGARAPIIPRPQGGTRR